MFEETRPFVKNILLLDSNGKRVAAKYFTKDWPSNSAKKNFEKLVFQKTNASIEGEIAMFENNIVIYKFVQDLHFFVTGGDDENELILATVLETFFDSVGLLLRGNVNKKEALEKLDLILLCIDQIVDDGIFLETNPNVFTEKVAGIDPNDYVFMLFGESEESRRMDIEQDICDRDIDKLLFRHHD